MFALLQPGDAELSLSVAHVHMGRKRRGSKAGPRMSLVIRTLPDPRCFLVLCSSL